MGTRACGHLSAMASPGVGEAGTTGDWRTERPELDYSRCVVSQTGEACCHVCWLFCPEAVISRSIPITVDMTYCKGCGICAEVCNAFKMVPEGHAGEE
jgi:pyruvate ferredoxin oxidoreductase delta subunit